MLTLNVPIHGSVTIGKNTLIVTGVDTFAGKAFFETRELEPPYDRRIPLNRGTTTQLFPNVTLMFKKIIHGEQIMVRLGFDAPQDIKITNGTGRPPKIDFKTVSDEELINYSKQWSRSALEDELRTRLEECLYD